MCKAPLKPDVLLPRREAARALGVDADRFARLVEAGGIARPLVRDGVEYWLARELHDARHVEGV